MQSWGQVLGQGKTVLIIIPSLIMGKVRSFPNKMEGLTVLIRLQREYRECSVMCFTQTRNTLRKTEITSDWHVTLYNFQLLRADRRAQEWQEERWGDVCKKQMV